jgi:hypothetical protein
MESNTCSSNKCRFCYSYKPSSITTSCCIPKLCATNEHLSSISSLQMVTFNSTRTSERSLLLQQQQQFLFATFSTQNTTVIQSTIQNAEAITNNLHTQLLQVRQQRYLPYQPYMPEVIPPSVLQLQMNTRNAGVPHSFFTIADCKGNQSVTT